MLITPYFPGLAKPLSHFNLGKKPLINLTYHLELDKQGIILVNFGLLEGNKKSYFPITLQQYAISNYNLYLTAKNKKQKEKHKQIFLKHTEFLKKQIQIKNNIAYWPVKRAMKIAGYKFKKPYNWPSSIVQGYGLSVFIRAHQLTKDPSYKELSKKIVNSFEWKIQKGGFLEIDSQNNYWYEEFPGIKHAHVLNGFIYSLLGLYEYSQYTKDKKAKQLFEKGIKTLENNIKKFNLNLGILKWSRYDSKKIFYSGISYHNKVHIPQLKILYTITKKPIFKEYHEKWLEYSKKYHHKAKLLNFPLLAFIKLRGILKI